MAAATETDRRITRGSMTYHYRDGYAVGQRGLPMPARFFADEYSQWLFENGYADGRKDRV